MNVQHTQPFPEDRQAPSQPQSNMEVHHHSHSHEKRNRKSYFREFLMLFLAVFCGFLAEYQLEHMIEHNREKQYMQAFIYDLENDTTMLSAGFPMKDERLSAIDSVFLFFERNTDARKVSGAVYLQMQRTTWDRAYWRNSTTIDQLKNAGGMRLIRKRAVADAIASYDLLWQRAEYWKGSYIRHQETGRAFLYSICDATNLLSVFRNYSDRQNMDSATISINPTISINKTKLNEYLNFLFIQKVSTTQDKQGYQRLKKSATTLIILIKKEYNLK